MFARLTIVQSMPDKIDEVTKIYGESVVPAAKKQKGFHAIELMVILNQEMEYPSATGKLKKMPSPPKGTFSIKSRRPNSSLSLLEILSARDLRFISKSDRLIQS